MPHAKVQPFKKAWLVNFYLGEPYHFSPFYWSTDTDWRRKEACQKHLKSQHPPNHSKANLDHQHHNAIDRDQVYSIESFVDENGHTTVAQAAIEK